MADSIVRLKVENSEYDAKIKRAAQGLQHMEEACRKVGGTLAVLEKDEKAFVQSLGKMETVSKSVRGKIGELTNAYTELRSQYNRLTEEEKKGDYGKELSASLEQIKSRINDAKGELNSINREINNGGSVLGQLSDKFGINIGKLGTWGAALGAGKMALDVMKDAFFASEANLDDWNRAVYASESAWDAFLTSINTGDISGYLSKIDSIISAAKDAYNEMDRLSTQKAINNPAIKALEAEIERLRAMLRTGRYISPNDGRQGAMKEGQVLTDAQKQKIAQSLQNDMARLNGFVRDEIAQTTRSIDALYKEQAGRLSMSLKEFKAGTANMGAFDERMAGYANYMAYEARRNNIRARANSGQNISDADSAILRGANPYQQYKAWGVFKDDGKLFGQINDLINQRASLQSQNYGNTANAYRAINRATGSGGRSGGGGTNTDANSIIDKLTFKEGEWETTATEWVNVNDKLQKQRKKEIESLQRLLDGDVQTSYSAKLTREDILGADTTPDIDVSGFDPDALPKRLEEEKKQAEELANAYSAAADAASSIGTALMGIEDPTAKVAGLIAQAIATIAATFAGSLKGTFTPWDWIAGAAAGTATMISTIAAIKSATAEYHAQGGFVGGPRGTDVTPMWATPGELVLNKAQQQNLASQLGGIGRNNMHLETTIHGEDLRIMLNNNSRRRGHGEYVTSRMV